MCVRSFISNGEIVQINLFEVQKLQLQENKIIVYFLYNLKTVYFSSSLFAEKEFSNIIHMLNNIAIFYKKNV